MVECQASGTNRDLKILAKNNKQQIDSTALAVSLLWLTFRDFSFYGKVCCSEWNLFTNRASSPAVAQYLLAEHTLSGRGATHCRIFGQKLLFCLGALYTTQLWEKSLNIDNRLNIVVRHCQDDAILNLKEKGLFIYHLGLAEHIKGQIDIFFFSSSYVKIYKCVQSIWLCS